VTPVPDEAILLRLVPEFRLPKIGTDGTPWSDTWAPSSDDNGTSVVILEGDVTAEGYRQHANNPGLMRISAGTIRAIQDQRIPGGLDVIRKPDPDDATIYGQAHALIVGWPTGSGGKKKIRQLVLNRAEWVGGPVFQSDP
jgi:hypothetical protein